MKAKKPKGLYVLSISIPDVLSHIERNQFIGFHSIHKKHASQKNIWDDFGSENSEINSDFFELKKKIQNETQSFVDNNKPSDKVYKELVTGKFTSTLNKKLTAKDSIYFTQEKLTPASFKTLYRSSWALVNSIMHGSLVIHFIEENEEISLMVSNLQSEFWAGIYAGSIGANSRDILVENARRAANIRHKHNRDIAEKIKQWFISNQSKYSSLDAAAEAASNLFPVAFRTARKHIGEIAKKHPLRAKRKSSK